MDGQIGGSGSMTNKQTLEGLDELQSEGLFKASIIEHDWCGVGAALNT